jgi:hypothetical protein
MGEARRHAFVAGAVAVLPIVVAATRAVLSGWQPVGDPSYSALRAWDVFSSHPPLIGTWSSGSNYSGRMFNHPGPLQFDVLAVPVRLLGHGPGAALGMAAINAGAVVLIGWLVRRQLGWEAVTLAMAACALLAWSLGSELLFDPSQHEPLYPFALFVVAVWATVAGDRAAGIVAVVAGSYVLQTHLSYSLLVLGFAAFAVIGSWRHVSRGWPSSLRWVAVVAAVGLVCWIQPLVEQIFGDGDGNLSALVGSVGTIGHGSPTPTAGQALRMLGGTLALPPGWLPPSYGDPAFSLGGTGPPTLLAALALVAMTGALVMLGWRALRRGAYRITSACAVGVMGILLAAMTTARTPIPMGLAPNYFRWLWPLGMLLWLTLALAVVEELRRAAPASEVWGLRSAPRGVVAHVGLGLAVVASVAALPRVDNGAGSQEWQVDALDDVDDAVLAAVDGHDGVLVEFGPTDAALRTAPGLFLTLQDAGVPFYVSYEPLARQVGSQRWFEPGDADLRVQVRTGPDEEAMPGERLIATSSPLSSDEKAELARLTAQVEDLVADHGLPLVPGAETIFAGSGRPNRVADIQLVSLDPHAAVTDGTLLELWDSTMTEVAGRPLLDDARFPARIMDRWAELEARRERQTIKVFASPIPEASD